MTQEESRLETIKIMRRAKTGQEITLALKEHFKKFWAADSKKKEITEIFDGGLGFLDDPLYR
jgi:hypothetical protein